MTIRPARNYLILLAAFALLVLASWPIVLSFDLWVLKDRGNLLNVDYLLERHLVLGVDAYYIYGLLPIWLQHLAVSVAGRGYWPLLAFDVPYVLLTAYFWAWFVAQTPQPPRWLLACVLLTPILLWANPNFPYVFVQLSLLFCLLFVYERRLEAALCVAVVGCYCVPSLPFVAAGVVGIFIVVEWWGRADRNVVSLARALAPGAAVFVLLGALLSAVFGFQSVVATLFPMTGAKFYQSNHYGLFTRGSGLDFIAPVGAGLRYYLANHAGWWIISSLVLFAFVGIALHAGIRRRLSAGATEFIVLCGALHAVFAFYAYSVPPQHIIYDPVLVAGVLGGLAWLSLGRWRDWLMIGIVGLGALGNWAQVHETWSAWRETRKFPDTAGLYATRDWAPEWTEVLRLSRERSVLLLSYGTGAHNYFPTLQSPDSWTLQWGQMRPADMERLVAKIAAVDVVVEDLSGPTLLIEQTPAITQALADFCLVRQTPNFRTFWKRTPSQSSPPCASPSDPRPDPGKS